MSNKVRKQRQYVVLVTLLMVVVASPAVLASKGIQWEKSIEKGLAKAQKTGKPIMMSFYTDW